MVLSERQGCGLSPVPLQCPVTVIYGGVPFEPNDEQCLQEFMSCNCFILVQSIYSFMICSHMVCCVYRVVGVGFHQIWVQDQSCNARIQAQNTQVKRATKNLVFFVGFSLLALIPIAITTHKKIFTQTLHIVRILLLCKMLGKSSGCQGTSKYKGKQLPILYDIL